MIRWFSKRSLMPNIVEVLEPVESVLDIGCGIMPQEYLQAKVHICCDPFPKYLEYLRDKVQTRKDKHFILMQAGWSDVVKIFPERSVDTVILVDVIEHLTKTVALQLLNSTTLLARRQVAIFTPLGFMPQQHENRADAWGLGGGEWQEHKSGWLPEDFDSTWDIYAAEVFHTHDNNGVLLDQPYGAMWAVKTNSARPDGASGRSLDLNRDKLRTLTNRLINCSPTLLTESLYRLLKTANRIIRF
jgi:hypothetical protein